MSLSNPLKKKEIKDSELLKIEGDKQEKEEANDEKNQAEVKRAPKYYIFKLETRDRWQKEGKTIYGKQWRFERYSCELLPLDDKKLKKHATQRINHLGEIS